MVFPDVPVNSIAADPTATPAEPLYVATDVGVYYSVKPAAGDRVWAVRQRAAERPGQRPSGLRPARQTPKSSPPPTAAASTRSTCAPRQRPRRRRRGGHQRRVGTFDGPGPYAATIDWGDGPPDTTAGVVATAPDAPTPSRAATPTPSRRRLRRHRHRHRRRLRRHPSPTTPGVSPRPLTGSPASPAPRPSRSCSGVLGGHLHRRQPAGEHPRPTSRPPSTGATAPRPAPGTITYSDGHPSRGPTPTPTPAPSPWSRPSTTRTAPPRRPQAAPPPIAGPVIATAVPVAATPGVPTGERDRRHLHRGRRRAVHRLHRLGRRPRLRGRGDADPERLREVPATTPTPGRQLPDHRHHQRGRPAGRGGDRVPRR